MIVLAPGVFQVTDQEVITIDVQSTGTTTLFGVNYSIHGSGKPIKQGVPAQITMDKSKAKGGSFIPNAKSTPLTLLFSFSSSSGGRYDLTLTGSDGGSFDDFAEQIGNTPESTTYAFHIL